MSKYDVAKTRYKNSRKEEKMNEPPVMPINSLGLSPQGYLSVSTGTKAVEYRSIKVLWDSDD